MLSHRIEPSTLPAYRQMLASPCATSSTPRRPVAARRSDTESAPTAATSVYFPHRIWAWLAQASAYIKVAVWAIFLASFSAFQSAEPRLHRKRRNARDRRSTVVGTKRWNIEKEPSSGMAGVAKIRGTLRMRSHIFVRGSTICLCPSSYDFSLLHSNGGSFYGAASRKAKLERRARADPAVCEKF